MMQRSNKNTQAVFIYEENSAKTPVLTIFSSWLPFLEKIHIPLPWDLHFSYFSEKQDMFEQSTWLLQWLLLSSFFTFSSPSLCVLDVGFTDLMNHILAEGVLLLSALRVRWTAKCLEWTFPFILLFAVALDNVLLGPWKDRMPEHLDHFISQATHHQNNNQGASKQGYQPLLKCPLNM